MGEEERAYESGIKNHPSPSMRPEMGLRQADVRQMNSQGGHYRKSSSR